MYNFILLHKIIHYRYTWAHCTVLSDFTAVPEYVQHIKHMQQRILQE